MIPSNSPRRHTTSLASSLPARPSALMLSGPRGRESSAEGPIHNKWWPSVPHSTSTSTSLINPTRHPGSPLVPFSPPRIYVSLAACSLTNIYRLHHLFLRFHIALYFTSHLLFSYVYNPDTFIPFTCRSHQGKT